MYVNPFATLDHKNPSTYITIFYENTHTLGSLEVEEEAVHKIFFTFIDWKR